MQGRVGNAQSCGLTCELGVWAESWVMREWTPGPGSRLTLAQPLTLPTAGGGILVIERLLDADGRGPLTTLLYSLNMLVQTEGRERTPGQYCALLAPAGFRDMRCQRTGGTYDAVLARK